MSDDVDFLSQLVRNSMEIQAQDAVSKTGEQDYNIMQPVQVTKHLNSTAPLLPILQVHYNLYFGQDFGQPFFIISLISEGSSPLEYRSVAYL